MFKKVIGITMVVGLSFVLSTPAQARNIKDDLADLKGRVAKLEDGPGSLDGLEIGGGMTFIIQGTDNSNADGISQDGVTDASYSADLEFTKSFGNSGKAFIHLEMGDGAGVTDELKLFSNVNADADDSDNAISATEAWYEYYFSNSPITLTFGHIDASSYIDTNEYANDETESFLSDMFKNSPAIEFPDDNSAVVRLAYAVSDSIELDVVAADADGDFENVFDTAFMGVQLNIKSEGGNYRLYSWQNNKKHTRWDDSSKEDEKAYGFGLSLDQELATGLAAFARYGWQNQDVFVNGGDITLASAWSFGINVAGSAWARGEDVCGIAYGMITPSDKYKEAGSLNGNNESHLEAYYNYRLNEQVSITPDIQFISNPYGGDAANGDKNIFVAGLRTQIAF